MALMQRYFRLLKPKLQCILNEQTKVALILVFYIIMPYLKLQFEIAQKW